jgi:DUF4097 and DUF4098 domain-containing protein YvlB
MTNWEFACSQPIDIQVDSWTSGSVAVAGEPTGTVTVQVTSTHPGRDGDALADEVRVSFDAGRLWVNGPRDVGFRRHHGLDLTIKAPAGSRLAAKTVSADVSCVGELGSLNVSTASGDVTAASVSGHATVQTASGDVMIREAATAKVNTASGDVHFDQVRGEATLQTVSGDVRVGRSGGSVDAHSVSGDVDISGVAAGNVSLNSMSGDLIVGVVPGIGVYLDLASTTGDIRRGLDDANDDDTSAAAEIRCRTVSGDILIRRASPATATAEPA